MSNHRCNHHFKRLCRHFTGLDPHPTHSANHRRTVSPFIAGFVTGQAEKVYNQTCPGMAAIPPIDEFDWVFALCGEIAAVYRLHVRVWKHDGKGEIWLLNESGLKLWGHLQRDLQNCPDNDKIINEMRAALCGIPTVTMDPAYPWRT